MKTLSQLTDFYYKELYPQLQDLDKRRKEIRFKIVLTSAFTLLIFAIILAFITKAYGFSFDLLFIGGALVSILFPLLYKFYTKEYTKTFKNRIITPLIQELSQRLSYTTSAYIPESVFMQSEIFQRPDRYRGNDYIKGIIDGVSLQFSDIHAEKKVKDSKGRTSWKTLFKGLYIVSDFHKEFHGHTMVLPDSAEKLFGNFLGQFLQSKNFTKNQLVKMDNSAFEKEFVVYATDQIEARYILSHTLMQKILELRNKTQHPLSIAFVANKVHIAIHYNKDLLEPTLFRSLLEYKTAMEYIKTLVVSVGIIHELKLNEKLWSKK